MKHTYDNQSRPASSDLSGLAVPTPAPIRQRLNGSTSSLTGIPYEVDQVGAAGILSELGHDFTAEALLCLARRKVGPEQCRVGANLIYSEDALLKFASTIERVVPAGDDTIDEPQIE
jgi:hypothetical protein